MTTAVEQYKENGPAEAGPIKKQSIGTSVTSLPKFGEQDGQAANSEEQLHDSSLYPPSDREMELRLQKRRKELNLPIGIRLIATT